MVMPALPRSLRTGLARVGQEFQPLLVQRPPDNVVSTPQGLIETITEPDQRTPFCYDILGQTQIAEAAAVLTFTFRVPGSFCPSRMVIDPADGVLIEAIQIGTENAVITAPIPGDLFGRESNCRLDSCLRCICMPGVPLTVRMFVPAAGTYNVTMLGCFREACNPDVPMVAVVAPDCPAYPEYLVGFAAEVPAGGTGEAIVSTPGRFCPRRIFMLDRGADTFLTAIVNGVENQIVTGETKTVYFDPTSFESCPPLAADCLCMPGVDLTFRWRNPDGVNNGLVVGAMVGTYEEACS